MVTALRAIVGAGHVRDDPDEVAGHVRDWTGRFTGTLNPNVLLSPEG